MFPCSLPPPLPHFFFSSAFFFFSAWNILLIVSPSGDFLLYFGAWNLEHFLMDILLNVLSLAKVPLSQPPPHCPIRATVILYHYHLGLCILIRLSILWGQGHICCVEIVSPLPHPVTDTERVLSKYWMNEWISLKVNHKPAFFYYTGSKYFTLICNFLLTSPVPLTGTTTTFPRRKTELCCWESNIYIPKEEKLSKGPEN